MMMNSRLPFFIGDVVRLGSLMNFTKSITMERRRFCANLLTMERKLDGRI